MKNGEKGRRRKIKSKQMNKKKLKTRIFPSFLVWKKIKSFNINSRRERSMYQSGKIYFMAKRDKIFNLSVCQPVCLSASLSVCLSVYLSACLSVCLSVCLSICQPVCLFASQSVSQSVCLSVSLCISR